MIHRRLKSILFIGLLFCNRLAFCGDQEARMFVLAVGGVVAGVGTIGWYMWKKGLLGTIDIFSQQKEVKRPVENKVLSKETFDAVELVNFFKDRYFKKNCPTDLSRQKNLKTAFDFTIKNLKTKGRAEPLIADKDTITELSVVGHFIDSIPVHTLSGKVALVSKAVLPIAQNKKLQEQQDLVCYLLNNSQLVEKIDSLLVKIKESEIALLNSENSVESKSSINLFFYRKCFDNLGWNNNAMILNVGVIMSTFMKFFFQFIFMGGAAKNVILGAMDAQKKLSLACDLSKKDKRGTDILFRKEYGSYISSMVAIGTAIINIVNVFKVADRLIQFENLMSLQKEMISIASYTKAVEELYEFIQADEMLATHFAEKSILDSFFDPEKKDLIAIRKELDQGTFKGSESYFSNHGNSLLAYKKILKPEIKKEFLKTTVAVGSLDALIGYLKKCNPSVQGSEYSFNTYQPSEQAVTIELKNVRSLNIESAVPNDIMLGGKDVPKDSVTMGLNRAGKSVVAKSVLFNVYLAQVPLGGLVRAEYSNLPVFERIRCFSNISDTEGEASRFQAELKRVQEQYSFEINNPNKKSLVFFDEPLTGTNADKIADDLVRIAQAFARNKRSIHMFVTHVPKMLYLGDMFVQFKVSGEKQPDGTYKPNYRWIVRSKDDFEIPNDAHEMIKNAGLPVS